MSTSNSSIQEKIAAVKKDYERIKKANDSYDNDPSNKYTRLKKKTREAFKRSNAAFGSTYAAFEKSPINGIRPDFTKKIKRDSKNNRSAKSLP